MKAYARLLGVQRRDRLAQREVARGPRVRTCEMPREEPLSRPVADAAQRGEARRRLVIGERRERTEVDVGLCEPDDVLGLPPREAEREQLVLACAGKQLARGK